MNAGLGHVPPLGRPVRSEEAADYGRDGYRVVAAALSPAKVDACLEALSGLAGSPGDGTREAVEDALSLAHSHPAMLAAASAALGGEALLLAAGFKPTSPGVLRLEGAGTLNPHTHDRELLSDPDGGFLLAWLALQDIALADGPMWVQPGSHRAAAPLQLRVFDRVEETHPGHMAGLETTFRAAVPEAGLGAALATHHFAMRRLLAAEVVDPRPLLLAKGDLLLFHPALLHGTVPPVGSPPPPRRSALMRFARADARLYANPFWMRAPVIEPARRLPDRRRSTPNGLMFDNYVAARLERLNVVPDASA